jgi:FkbM family methyltransferase
MLPNALRTLLRPLRPLIPASIQRIRELRPVRLHAAQKGLKLIPYDLFFDLRRDNTVLRIRNSHRVYLAHMIDNFDYYVDSVIPLHLDGLTIVDMSGPRFHRLQGFGDIPFLFPSHTEPYVTTAEYLEFAALKEGEIVLDIGAYSGVTSIIFAQLVGERGRVYAFEADRVNHECAQVNVEMSARVMGLKNISLFHNAVWSNNGGLLFSNEGAMGSSAVSITGGNRGIETVVPSILLQDFFATHGLDHADFVKIDIEGGEIEVLKASAGFLKSMNARLIVEPHLVDGVLSTDRCCRILQSAGYKVRIREKVGESEPLIEAVP